MLTRSFCTEDPKIKSKQQETDTHLVLHTKHEFNKGIQNVLAVGATADVMAFVVSKSRFKELSNIRKKGNKIIKELQICSYEAIFQVT